MVIESVLAILVRIIYEGITFIYLTYNTYIVILLLEKEDIIILSNNVEDVWKHR